MATKHVIRIADHNGDTVVAYDPDVKSQVKAAQEQFEQLVREGHMAYEARGNGDNVMATTFDPSVETYVVVPALRGG